LRTEEHILNWASHLENEIKAKGTKNDNKQGNKQGFKENKQGHINNNNKQMSKQNKQEHVNLDTSIAYMQNSSKAMKEAPKVCFFCEKKGYIKRDCKELKESIEAKWLLKIAREQKEKAKLQKTIQNITQTTHMQKNQNENYANNSYTETTKENILITEKQDKHMLASNYSSDAKEEMLLNPETESSNNAFSDNKATYEAQEIKPISTTATYCLPKKSLEEILSRRFSKPSAS
ncbi:14115_t:CDS:2, partial [Cetraspora pellucida]